MIVRQNVGLLVNVNEMELGAVDVMLRTRRIICEESVTKDIGGKLNWT